MSIKVGQFQTRTGTTGTKAVSGVGFQPTGLVLFTTGINGNGTQVQTIFLVGLASGSSAQASTSFSSNDGQASSDVARRQDVDSVYSAVAFNQTVIGSADLQSFDSDGFTLNFTAVEASERTINYVAFGGDITAQLVKQDARTTTGDQSITGAGFAPTAVIAMSSLINNTGSASSADINWSMGWGTSGTDQFAMGGGSTDAAATMANDSVQRSDRLIHASNSAGSVVFSASLSSLDADGCTVNWNTVLAGSRPVFYLFLGGVSAKAGVETQKTSTGTKATTGAGFQPRGALFASWCQAASTSVQSHLRMALGATDGTNYGAIFAGERDGVADSIADRAQSNAKALVLYTEGTPTLDADAELSSFDSDGFTFNWTTADATARQFGYLAIEEAAATNRRLMLLGVGT